MSVVVCHRNTKKAGYETTAAIAWYCHSWLLTKEDQFASLIEQKSLRRLKLEKKRKNAPAYSGSIFWAREEPWLSTSTPLQVASFKYLVFKNRPSPCNRFTVNTFLRKPVFNHVGASLASLRRWSRCVTLGQIGCTRRCLHVFLFLTHLLHNTVFLVSAYKGLISMLSSWLWGTLLWWLIWPPVCSFIVRLYLFGVAQSRWCVATGDCAFFFLGELTAIITQFCIYPIESLTKLQFSLPLLLHFK